MTRLMIHLALAALLCAASACKTSRDKRAPARSDEPASAPGAADRAPAWPVDPRGPGRIVITQIAIETVDPEGQPARELFPRELARVLGRQLGSTQLFAADAAQVAESEWARPASIAVRVGYDFVNSAERGGRVAVVALESRVLWDDPEREDMAPAMNVFAERLLDAHEHGNEDGILSTLVADGLAQIGHGLIAKEQVRAGGVEAIVHALGSKDVDLMLFALDLTAERGHVELLDTVMALLGAGEETVRNRAVTTLVALGDPRAVDAMARSAAFDDHPYMRMVIEAAAALGGEDAHEYLEFIATGHPDRELRAHAQDGLLRLMRRGREE